MLSYSMFLRKSQLEQDFYSTVNKSKKRSEKKKYVESATVGTKSQKNQ
jgi:hypothetical protein